MMVLYMKMPDGLEVVHSGIEQREGIETVRIYFERPVETGFDTAECLLPHKTWSKIKGFSGAEIGELVNFVNRQDDLIFDIARQEAV